MTDISLDAAAAAELRRLVSEVLAEVLPGMTRPDRQAEVRPLPATVAPSSLLAAGGVPSGVPAGAPDDPVGQVPASTGSRNVPARLAAVPRPARSGADESWIVSLDTDADLDAFVRRVLKLADNPKARQDLIAGRVRFRLAGRAAGAATTAVHRVEKGAVTERAVAEAARLGARIVVGRRAVLTPLARDKARALGVPIDKER